MNSAMEFIICAILIMVFLMAVMGLAWIAMAFYRAFFVKRIPRKKPPKKVTIETIELTERLQAIIDKMIIFAVNRKLQSNKVLETRYDVKLMDKDVKEIAAAVFNGLNKDLVFDSSQKELVFTNEYLMEYIVSATSSYFLETVVRHNDQAPASISGR